MDEDVYILWAQLIHFQNHQKTLIHFNAGSNALIGTSDSGKSAFLRGIIWTLDNKPGGVNFIQVGKSFAEGRVALSNGNVIVRYKNRNNSINTYDVLREGESIFDAPLTGFGSGVPKAVLEARGMPDLRFIFASQLEPSFLIHETPASRAKTIGNFDELGKVDKALTLTNEDIRSDGKALREMKKAAGDMEKELKQLEKEIKLEAPKVAILERLKAETMEKHQVLQIVQRAAFRLSSLREELQLQREVADRAARIIEAWPDSAVDLEAMAESVEKASKRMRQLEEERNSIEFMNAVALGSLEEILEVSERETQRYHYVQRAAERMRELEKEVKHVQSSYSPRLAAINFTQLDADVERYRLLVKSADQLKLLQAQREEMNQTIKESTAAISEQLDRFVEFLRSAQICPTCHQPTHGITHDHAQSILS